MACVARPETIVKEQPSWLTDKSENDNVVGNIRSFIRILESFAENTERIGRDIAKYGKRSSLHDWERMNLTEDVITTILDVHEKIVYKTCRLANKRPIKQEPKEEEGDFELPEKRVKLEIADAPEYSPGSMENLLTDIGITTYSPQVVIVDKHGRKSKFSNSAWVTFELGSKRADALLKLFDGDHCDLWDYGQKLKRCRMDLCGVVLRKKLSDWEILKLETMRLTVDFLCELYPSFLGFDISSSKFTMENEIVAQSLRSYAAILTTLAEKTSRGECEEMMAPIIASALDAHAEVVGKMSKSVRKRKSQEMHVERKIPVITLTQQDEYTDPSATAADSAFLTFDPPASDFDPFPTYLVGNIRSKHSSITPGRQRFTFLALEGGHFGKCEDATLVAKMLTDLGIGTSPDEVVVPIGQHHDSFASISQFTRVTFEVNAARTAQIMMMFDGERCELKDHIDEAEFPIFYKTCLLQELTEWDALKIDTILLAVGFISNVYPYEDGYSFNTFKHSLTVFKDQRQVKTLDVEDLILEHVKVFAQSILLLKDVGRDEMKKYAVELIKETFDRLEAKQKIEEMENQLLGWEENLYENDIPTPKLKKKTKKHSEDAEREIQNDLQQVRATTAYAFLGDSVNIPDPRKNRVSTVSKSIPDPKNSRSVIKEQAPPAPPANNKRSSTGRFKKNS
ncbi:unnamed protein product [Caenorhabditis sp. 36 PRJEB53466]|nr:unnamed protein product [Caenorhabditis sp. 36 PRJEB53466]